MPDDIFNYSPMATGSVGGCVTLSNQFCQLPTLAPVQPVNVTLSRVEYPAAEWQEYHLQPSIVERWVDNTGTLYQLDGLFLSPSTCLPNSVDEAGIVKPGILQPGHRLDTTAPLRCPQCGTDRLQVYRRNPPRMHARCLDCGLTDVIAEEVDYYR